MNYQRPELLILVNEKELDVSKITDVEAFRSQTSDPPCQSSTSSSVGL